MAVWAMDAVHAIEARGFRIKSYQEIGGFLWQPKYISVCRRLGRNS